MCYYKYTCLIFYLKEMLNVRGTPRLLAEYFFEVNLSETKLYILMYSISDSLKSYFSIAFVISSHYGLFINYLLFLFKLISVQFNLHTQMIFTYISFTLKKNFNLIKSLYIKFNMKLYW